jgi:hypothetical protein
MGQFLAEGLQRAAQERADGVPPNRPKRGRALVRRQKPERAIDASVGEFKLSRPRGFRRQCQDWFCPADEARPWLFPHIKGIDPAGN